MFRDPWPQVAGRRLTKLYTRSAAAVLVGAPARCRGACRAVSPMEARGPSEVGKGAKYTSRLANTGVKGAKVSMLRWRTAGA